MIVYLVAMCLLGWLVAKQLVAFHPRWWMLIVAPVVAFASVFLAGLALMFLEAGGSGLEAAFNSFALSLLPALACSIWAALLTYKRQGQNLPAGE